jgi:3-methylcrotonyl-CoA carboxylase alpha subunit
VPTTPGYLGENQSAPFLQERAGEIGYPILIKAVAGGGGKGMRKVDSAADFADALASCRREAAASFGNDHVLLEKYIERPRHIEVQIFGDNFGNVVHLFERDCSLQRRHQKVIEEAPAPGMDAATRQQLCATAIRAAKAVDYVGAGTIEFIADASAGLRADRIWFMEMNTRLQVEHPVTEEITGVDLVEWQLRVASGGFQAPPQDSLKINGWAMEARLYAEDPLTGFLPSIGPLEHFKLQGQRIETGVEQGGEVSPFYDPMIAKLIAHAPTREEALRDLKNACRTTDVWPVKTNAAFLGALLEEPDFIDGLVDTNFIAAHQERLSAVRPLSEDALNAAIHNLVDTRGMSEGALGMSGLRLNAPPKSSLVLDIDGQRVEASIPKDWHPQADYLSRATWSHGALIKFDGGHAYRIGLYRPRGSHEGRVSDGLVLSPMPGRIILVEVATGDKVQKGQKLLTLEAMKMEHVLTAPFDGVVAELTAHLGAQVQVEAVLVRIEPGSGQ